MSSGADLNLKSSQGTPLELAMDQMLSDEIITLLGGQPSKRKKYDRGAIFNKLTQREQAPSPATIEFQTYSWLLEPLEVEFQGELG